MKTIIVINGEHDWQAYLPGFEVHHRKLQTSRWLYHEGKLWVFDNFGSVRVDCVLWRVGAIKPHPSHRTVLELIRMARIPCVNSVDVLLRCYDRLSMLNEMQEAGIPLLASSVVLGENMLDTLNPAISTVIKVGNYHGGFGKMRIQNAEQWADARDMSFVTDDYIIVEPYIEYVQDVRCLAVGKHMWTMARRGAYWKANQQTAYERISTPPVIGEYTARAMHHFKADVLGLDFIQAQDGSYVLLECNDTPGLSGFPDDVRAAVAHRVLEKMNAVG